MVSAIINNMQSVSSKVSSLSSNIQTISLSVHSYSSLELLLIVWQIYFLQAIIVRQWVNQMRVSVWMQQSLQQQYIQNSVYKCKPTTENIKRCYNCGTTTDRCCNCCRSSNMMSAMQVMKRGKYMQIFLSFK